MKYVVRMVLLGALTLAHPASAQELGRLFLTPEQRAALDHARYVETASTADGHDDGEASVSLVAEDLPVTSSNAVRVDGYVSRSDGPQTVWVNGMDSHQGNFGDIGLDPHQVTLESARVRLPLGDAPRGILLKPGQSFDPVLNEVSDAYEIARPATGEGTDD